MLSRSRERLSAQDLHQQQTTPHQCTPVVKCFANYLDRMVAHHIEVCAECLLLGLVTPSREATSICSTRKKTSRNAQHRSALRVVQDHRGMIHRKHSSREISTPVHQYSRQEYDLDPRPWYQNVTMKTSAHPTCASVHHPSRTLMSIILDTPK